MTNEQFVERVLDNFDKINNKIDKLHAETGDQIKDLCDKIANAQKSIDNHLLTNTVLDIANEKELKKRDRKFYIVIALMSIGFTLYEITKDLFI